MIIRVLSWMVEKTQSSDINVFNFKKYILFSHEKELNSAICRDINGPRDCHTERSQKEKNKYILMHICGI